MSEDMKEMDWLDNEIDKWWCSQFTSLKMKRVSDHKFIPEPAFTDKTLGQIELCLDWQVEPEAVDWDDATIREFAKYFYNLGKNAACSN